MQNTSIDPRRRLALKLTAGSIAATVLQGCGGAQASGMPEYQRYLDSHGLSDVSPMQSLLHSARRWRECRS